MYGLGSRRGCFLPCSTTVHRRGRSAAMIFSRLASFQQFGYSLTKTGLDRPFRRQSRPDAGDQVIAEAVDLDSLCRTYVYTLQFA